MIQNAGNGSFAGATIAQAQGMISIQVPCTLDEALLLLNVASLDQRAERATGRERGRGTRSPTRLTRPTCRSGAACLPSDRMAQPFLDEEVGQVLERVVEVILRERREPQVLADVGRDR